MTISLPKRQTDWLEARVADGTFAPVEEGAATIIEERMELEADDLAWATQAVAEARRDIAEGRTLTLDEHRGRVATRLARIGG